MTTIANEYASALYGLADEEGLQDRISPEMRVLETLIGDQPEIMKVLGAPNIPREERCGVIDTCFGAGMHPYVINTMKIMCEKGYARHLKDMCAAYDKLYREGHGIISVKAYSAVALTVPQREKLTAKLEKMTGKKIRLENIVQPECLGGVRLDFDGRQIDDTIRHRLKEMRDLIGG